MKILLGGAAMAAIVSYFYYHRQPADVYAMPLATAYEKLNTFEFEPWSEGAKVLHMTRDISGNGVDKVTWSEHGDMSAYKCDLQLAPYVKDAAKTHVTVTCEGGGAGDGAAAGMTHNLHRNRVIEHVDAALAGHPFRPERANATASAWPGDGVDGSLITAERKALEMDAAAHRQN